MCAPGDEPLALVSRVPALGLGLRAKDGGKLIIAVVSTAMVDPHVGPHLVGFS